MIMIAFVKWFDIESLLTMPSRNANKIAKWAVDIF